jgi:CheY-like chemotaxis protein
MFHFASLSDQPDTAVSGQVRCSPSENGHSQKMNAAQQLKILYVDDDENDQALFRLAAEEAKLDIWLNTAMDIRQAIAHLTGEGEYANRLLFPVPDVVLLDLSLPRTSGIEFLIWCKDRAIIVPPVIVLSSSLRPSDKEQALSVGAADYLEKPLGLDRLRRTVVRIWSFGMNWKRRQSRTASGAWVPPVRHQRPGERNTL